MNGVISQHPGLHAVLHVPLSLEREPAEGATRLLLTGLAGRLVVAALAVVLVALVAGVAALLASRRRRGRSGSGGGGSSGLASGSRGGDRGRRRGSTGAEGVRCRARRSAVGNNRELRGPG